MTLKFLGYAAWAAAAGALIPLMAVLNARLGRALGAPIHAAVILFLIGLLTATIVSLLATGRLPNPQMLTGAKVADFAGGAIVAGYVISVTLLAPRFGVGNATLFVMTAQIITSAAIDHFGMFGATVRPVNGLRLLGLAVMLVGLTISQLAKQTSHSSHSNDCDFRSANSTDGKIRGL